ncbi:MAG: PHP domain-containing protein [Austwickia sp.]|nr:PHP domain-containing protein [Austwickia sp.]MBK8435965.1 PHP domain-containing protein [Austwickia sp.]MBK9101648.1 PHP domain-containing protein [Austwickia sp.]
MLIDLHTHSRASDGTQTPAELVAEAAGRGLSVLGLTDHDTTAGWAEAEVAAQRARIILVRGIEVSCLHDGISLHVLSYLHDPDDPPLLAELERARASRQQRARLIVDRLAEDFPLAYDDVLAQVHGDATVGRPHIADAMVAAGIVSDRDAAFREYLYTGSPYYVTHYAPDPVTAVRLIRAAGGVPVMAHPFAAARGRIVSDDVIASMAQAGLAGLEARHPDHTPDQVAHAAGLARELGLLASGASDYHGAGKTVRLAQEVTPPPVYEAILAQARGVALVGGGRGDQAGRG